MLKDYALIKAVSTLIIPCISIFALYILFNGEDSPGGGFQAGVIFATALTCYAIYNPQQLRSVVSEELLLCGAASGALIYGCTGVVTVLLGGNFLDYYALPLAGAQPLGILIIEIGIGLSVFSAMTLIYLLFTA